jgi:hypothetical protein
VTAVSPTRTTLHSADDTGSIVIIPIGSAPGGSSTGGTTGLGSPIIVAILRDLVFGVDTTTELILLVTPSIQNGICRRCLTRVWRAWATHPEPEPCRSSR